MRSIPCVVIVLALSAWEPGSARAHVTAGSPSTVVAALVDGDPTNGDVEAAAREIASMLRIDRTAQARRWQMEVLAEDVVLPADGEARARETPRAVAARMRGRMSDSSLSISYASDADRNVKVAGDAAVAAYALAGARSPSGDAISVMHEGAELRLVYSNEDGVPIRTLRSSRERLLGTVQRLVSGDTESTVGAWQQGQHRIVVRLGAGAPTVLDAQSSLDKVPTTARALCKAGGCAFASPPGKLRMRFDEVRWDGPLAKTVELDQDLLVTVRPGRRYWAKYTGIGMISAGTASVAVVMLSGALQALGAKGACSLRPTAGPEDDCDTSVRMSSWEGAALAGGVGTIAVGAVLYLVVHKKPGISVSPLGAAQLTF